MTELSDEQKETIAFGQSAIEVVSRHLSRMEHLRTEILQTAEKLCFATEEKHKQFWELRSAALRSEVSDLYSAVGTDDRRISQWLDHGTPMPEELRLKLRSLLTEMSMANKGLLNLRNLFL
jgi:hypothetical protein